MPTSDTAAGAVPHEQRYAVRLGDGIESAVVYGAKRELPICASSPIGEALLAAYRRKRNLLGNAYVPDVCAAFREITGEDIDEFDVRSSGLFRTSGCYRTGWWVSRPS